MHLRCCTVLQRMSDECNHNRWTRVRARTLCESSILHFCSTYPLTLPFRTPPPRFSNFWVILRETRARLYRSHAMQSNLIVNTHFAAFCSILRDVHMYNFFVPLLLSNLRLWNLAAFLQQRFWVHILLSFFWTNFEYVFRKYLKEERSWFHEIQLWRISVLSYAKVLRILKCRRIVGAQIIFKNLSIFPN